MSRKVKETSKKKLQNKINLKFKFSLSFSLLTFGVLLSFVPDFFFNTNITNFVKGCCCLLGMCTFSYYSTKLNDNKKGVLKIIVGLALVGLGIVLFMLDKMKIEIRILFSLLIFGGSVSFFYGLQEAIHNIYLKFTVDKINNSIEESSARDFKWIKDGLAILLVVLQIVCLVLESTDTI